MPPTEHVNVLPTLATRSVQGIFDGMQNIVSQESFYTNVLSK